mmetsp:Transcript_16342/g.35822  ORF Transcript_16342/g.35822 Transcript_16342/m.35822 type:complete len:212 (+) Transcript_16342:362-997(+)
MTRDPTQNARHHHESFAQRSRILRGFQLFPQGQCGHFSTRIIIVQAPLDPMNGADRQGRVYEIRPRPSGSWRHDEAEQMQPGQQGQVETQKNSQTRCLGHEHIGQERFFIGTVQSTVRAGNVSRIQARSTGCAIVRSSRVGSVGTTVAAAIRAAIVLTTSSQRTQRFRSCRGLAVVRCFAGRWVVMMMRRCCLLLLRRSAVGFSKERHAVD